jgi:PAS domain-containing protein
MGENSPEKTLNELKESKNILKEFLESYSKSESIIDLGSHVIIPKETFESLKENQKSYKTLFELAPTYTVLLGLDGKVKNFNKKTEEFAGVPREKLIGMRFTEILCLKRKCMRMLKGFLNWQRVNLLNHLNQG